MTKSRWKNHGSLSLPTLMLSFGAASGFFSQTIHAQDTTAVPPRTDSTLTVSTLTVSNTVPANATYWKHPQYGATVMMWECAEKGLCARVVALDPEDKRLREMAAKILEKDVRKVTAEDVMGFIGMEGQMELKKEGDKWKGRVYWPFKKKFYGLDVTQKDSTTLDVHGFLIRLPFIGRTVKLQQAKPPGI
jgi:uncharacterized protein (DUF2147 family)